MIAKFLFFFLFTFTGILNAQDTIFVRNGQIIPAIVVEKNNTEIKYKKFGQPEPAAIYSIFVSDILSIHFKDGIIADYTMAGQPGADDKPATAIGTAGTMKSIKFSVGLNADHINRNINNDLLEFWRFQVDDPNAVTGGNSLSFPFLFRMTFVVGNSGRNFLGDELQLILTPSDAIYATNDNGSYEISLGTFYYNITMFYGRALNHKRNMIGIVEPGFDLGFISGYIKLDDTKYNIRGNLGTGFHFATGIDWVISKRIVASGRAGYRSMKAEESHVSSTSSTGYSQFYVNPSVSEKLLTVKSNGSYFSFGLTWSFYGKMK
jgi:hypothetical protein